MEQTPAIPKRLIPRWRARDNLGASDKSFTRFCERHKIHIYSVAGGEVLDEDEYDAAVRSEVAEAINGRAA